LEEVPSEVAEHEVAEGEMVEKNLVIPDEMMHFLSQVSLPVKLTKLLYGRALNFLIG
jgi:hypothetical protein